MEAISRNVSPGLSDLLQRSHGPPNPQQRTKLPAELDSREVRDTMG